MSAPVEPSRSDGSRARLFDAALAAFAAKGFHGTTTRDIAAAAGMSPAALYVHHKSKEELLYLIARTGNQAALEQLDKCIAISDDPVEQMHEVVRDFATRSAEHHTITRVINAELGALSPEHRADIRAMRQRFAKVVHDVIERGVDAGVFQVEDPEIVATALISLGIDVARWYRDGGRLTPTAVGDHYADLAMRMLGVNAAPAGRDKRPKTGRGKGARKRAG
jgi:AcrR family transcriptional regulator